MRLQQEIETLIRDLAHQSYQVRAAASYSLIDIGRPAVPALIGLLRTSGDLEARILSAFVLGRLQAEEAVPALIDALELPALDRPEARLADQVTQALLSIGTQRALRAVQAYHNKFVLLHSWWNMPGDS